MRTAIVDMIVHPSLPGECIFTSIRHTAIISDSRIGEPSDCHFWLYGLPLVGAASPGCAEPTDKGDACDITKDAA